MTPEPIQWGPRRRRLAMIAGMVALTLLLVAAPAAADPPAGVWYNESPTINERPSLRLDVNGDNRDDLVYLENDQGTQTLIRVALGTTSGTFGATITAWSSPAGAFDLGQLRVAGGDHTQDGQADLLVLYDYGGGQSKLLDFRADFEGPWQRFLDPVVAWDSGPGYWNIQDLRVASGDWNGDGLVDLAVWQHNEAYTRMTVFRAVGDGSFAPPYLQFNDVWPWSSYLVAGDFNDDGHDDLAVMLGLGNADTQLWVFTGYSGGLYVFPVLEWQSGPGVWDPARSRLVGGDFNGDGRDDLAAFYDYNSHDTGLWVFTAGANGHLGAPQLVWRTGPGQWNVGATKLVGGDFNGDGRGDVFAFYDYFPGDTGWLMRITPKSGLIPQSFQTLSRGTGIYGSVHPV